MCVWRREEREEEREEEKEPGIQNQKQEPHTKLWGKNCIQFIRISSNSFVCLPKKIEPQFVRISSNSIRMSSKKLNTYFFVYLPIHSYVFPPKKKQFIRMTSNSFVCLPPKKLSPNSFVYFSIHPLESLLNPEPI